MPGSPLEFFAGRPGSLTQERVDELLELWGFNDPLHERYSRYIVNMLTLQFGRSARTGKPVVEIIQEALPNTFLLMGFSTVLAIFIGILLGAVSAYKRGGAADTGLVFTSLITYSLPTFWMGMMFLIAFGLRLNWFPIGKTVSYWTEYPTGLPPPLFEFQILSFSFRMPGLVELADRLWHLFLPAAVLVLFQYGGYLLLTRATMVEALSEDYIVTARAKGLQERVVLFRHALRNASLPIITSAAMAFGFMLSGAIITETVFSWPGLGGLTWEAIQLYDYPILHVLFYVIALCVILANFLADLMYGIVDPRIKYG
ncbi:ABC transporter permease [Candidatus Bathyarchaeota archaeon]|nr:ABC transporter permease [Candidatus Bathyarchaeota archaeon]